MTDLELLPPGQAPRRPRRGERPVDRAGLEAALRQRVDGDVRFDAAARGAYTTDASNYRQVPIAVVVPRTVEDAATAIAVCLEHDVPVLSRGGGTSLAGQCTNTAAVVDWSTHCRRLVSVDVAAAPAPSNPASCSTISTPGSPDTG